LADSIVESFAITELQHTLAKNGNREYSVRMAQYMKNQFPFYGIQSTPRRHISRQWLKNHPIVNETDTCDVLKLLWGKNQREFQYIGSDIAKKNKRKLTPKSIPTLEYCIRTKSWWDTVDALAAHPIGMIVQHHPGLISLMDQWIEDENMWIRRTALLYQLQYKEKTNQDRLFRYCELRMDDSEFFIRKAIGWVLRQYSYIDPDAVIDFVDKWDGRLSNLSKREGLKAIHRNV